MPNTFLLDTFAGRYIEDGDCLRWTGACAGKKHHPAINLSGPRRTILVRRLLWEEKHGEIPAGKIVRCTCETPACINVDHCELTTFQQLAKQLGALGVMSGPVRSANIAASHRARHPLTRLTQDQAREIRGSDEPGTVLAKRYDVSESAISRIRRGTVRREFAASPWAGLGG